MGAHVLAVTGSSMSGVSARLRRCGSGALAALIASAAIGVGCGSRNCQNTCGHIYDGSECGIQVSGISLKKLKSDCIIACEDALEQAGEMGSYNPYDRDNPSNPAQLENERQAAEWMNCVWSVECTELDPSSGICAPI